MRIRFPFLIAFVVILLAASSGGLLPHSVLPSAPEAAIPYIPRQSDKALHFLVFFALTASFYFILDTSRRRVLHLTLVVCTLILGVGSEVAQGLLPNDRQFDPWDILANVLGSLAALGLANAYHKRSAERRRRAKYESLGGAAGEEDLELGEGLGVAAGGQESGIADLQAEAQRHKALEREVDHFDENQPDDFDNWEEEDESNEPSKATPATSSVASEDNAAKKKLAVD